MHHFLIAGDVPSSPMRPDCTDWVAIAKPKTAKRLPLTDDRHCYIFDRFHATDPPAVRYPDMTTEPIWHDPSERSRVLELHEDLSQARRLSCIRSEHQRPRACWVTEDGRMRWWVKVGKA